MYPNVFIHSSDQEKTQQMSAWYTYNRSKHGIVADFICLSKKKRKRGETRIPHDRLAFSGPGRVVSYVTFPASPFPGPLNVPFLEK